MKDKTLADVTRDEIQKASERIAKALHQKGEVRLEQVAKETNFQSHIFEWAIGYLVHQNEVEIIPDGDSFLVRRKEPDTHAPVFI